ncbi:MAG: beta-lactamase family protein, partial [Anaerolineae bacterium]|nr:beta-lactamase family protein [Anaerolineae bacterium]
MRKKLLIIVILIVAVFSPLTVQAQTPVTEDLLTAFETVIQTEMDYFDIPGAAVAVIAGDDVVYAEGFGERDLEAGAPFTTATRFRIGSTTKSLTSLLIAQLVDEGLLTWDTPVTDLLPEFATADPERTAQMKLRDLMGMGSGLVSSNVDGLYWGDWDVDALLEAVAAQTIDGDLGL